LVESVPPLVESVPPSAVAAFGIHSNDLHGHPWDSIPHVAFCDSEPLLLCSVSCHDFVQLICDNRRRKFLSFIECFVVHRFDVDKRKKFEDLGEGTTSLELCPYQQVTNTDINLGSIDGSDKIAFVAHCCGHVLILFLDGF
jgi:hypothetical protein